MIWRCLHRRIEIREHPILRWRVRRSLESDCIGYPEYDLLYVWEGRVIRLIGELSLLQLLPFISKSFYKQNCIIVINCREGIRLPSITIYMKHQFNTFAANSPALSDYYSPKNTSHRMAFPSSSNDLSCTSALDPFRFITAPSSHYNKAYRPDKRIIAEEDAEGRRSEGM